ncbi:MAG: hypothetical protein ABL934_12450 [Lysobacteraceae bacterium]
MSLQRASRSIRKPTRSGDSRWTIRAAGKRDRLLQLSARSIHRILRVARTVGDISGSADILGPHVAEAIGYRRGELIATSRVA